MTSIGATAKNLSQPALTTIQGLFTDWQKPNLLDAVAKEIFFADEVVFFEGQEDVGLLRKFAIEHNREPLEVFGYGVGGSGNIKHFLKMAEELGIRACAIYDGDKTAEKAEAEQLFPVSLIELLPTADIRDKHAKDASGRDAVEIKKEGLFDRNGVIKPAYKQYLLDLMDRVTAQFNGPQ